MNKLKLLTKELNEASRIYYTENRQIMSNKEWDAKYDELVSLNTSWDTLFLTVRQRISDTVSYPTLKKLPMRSLPSLWIRLRTGKHLLPG